MSEDDTESIRRWLSELPSEILVDWLASYAREDETISRSLKLRRELDAGQDLSALKKLVSGLIGGTPQFVDRRRGRKLVQVASQIRTAIKFALQRGDVTTAAQACEYAILRLIRLYARSDDSSGLLNAALHKLADFHHEVIKHEGASGVALARRMAPLMAEDEWEFFPMARWQPLLTDSGLATLEKRWRSSYAKKKKSEYRNHNLRGRIADLMRVREDTAGLIDWLAESAHASWEWAEVVRLCEEQGRRRQAIEIAERATRQHVEDDGLRVLLAGLYSAEGFNEEALELLWKNFCRRPTPDAFVAIREAARQDWPRWRERALEFAGKAESRTEPNVSLRVTLLLTDGDPEAALTASEDGHCWASVWRELARALTPLRPQSARDILLQLLPESLEQACASSNYDDIGRLLRELRPVSTPVEFEALIDRIRNMNRRRPKLVALLDGLHQTGAGVALSAASDKPDLSQA